MNAPMLTLYYKTTCGYSRRVLDAAEALGVALNLKDVMTDTVLLDELMQKGGKNQVPFLVDAERGVSMYESESIIAYLEEHYSSDEVKKNFSGVRIHKSDDACNTCQ